MPAPSQRRLTSALSTRPEVLSVSRKASCAARSWERMSKGISVMNATSASGNASTRLEMPRESRRPGTGLRVTKRGPGLARKYLYLAALRLIMSEPLARAWYEGRKAYQGGKKVKAVVALMRKYARGLWHVGRGQAFDAAKLFDTRRLVPRPAEEVQRRRSAGGRFTSRQLSA